MQESTDPGPGQTTGAPYHCADHRAINKESHVNCCLGTEKQPCLQGILQAALVINPHTSVVQISVQHKLWNVCDYKATVTTVLVWLANTNML